MSLSKPQRLHKPRFRDWLIDILDRQVTDDAKWVDQNIAVIRWPHKSRGTWSLEKDAQLFALWAMTSGKYRPNVDIPNPKSWKCNFRMNLNICKCIEELKNRRVTKGPNACRYFKFLDRGNPLPSWYQSNSVPPFEPKNICVNHGRRGTAPPSAAGNGMYPCSDVGLMNTDLPTQLGDEFCVPYSTVLSSQSSGLDHLDTSSKLSLPINNFKTTELSRMADNFKTTELSRMADNLLDNFDISQCM